MHTALRIYKVYMVITARSVFIFITTWTQVRDGQLTLQTQYLYGHNRHECIYFHNDLDTSKGWAAYITDQEQIGTLITVLFTNLN